MSGTTNSGRVPRLRFPEFKNAGEWETNTLGSACSSFSGGTPSTSKPEYYGGNIPFIRSAEISRDKTELFLTHEGLTTSSAKMVTKGDILVALYGANSGDVALAKIDGAINQAILCLKSKKSNAFIYQFLSFIKDQIVATYIQGGQGNLSGEIIKSIAMPFPHLREQQRIASCLTRLDDLISGQAQKLDSLKAHKKGLMQQLFPCEGETQPRLRFPEFQEAGEWAESIVSELIVTVSPPKKLQTSDYQPEGEFPIVDQSKDYICGWTDDGEAVIEKGLPVIVFGDHTCALKFIDQPFAQGADGIKIFRSKRGIDIRFLFNALEANPVVQESYKRHFSMLKEMNLFYPEPNLDEQQRIASCLTSLDDLITAQTQKLEALKTHKKGLMQQLFPQVSEE